MNVSASLAWNRLGDQPRRWTSMWYVPGPSSQTMSAAAGSRPFRRPPFLMRSATTLAAP